MSCDLLSSESPGPHYQCDIRRVIDMDWDILIAHPSCTYLTCSAEWLYKPRDQIKRNVKPGVLVGEERAQARREAIEFVRMLLGQDHIPRIAVENPVGVLTRHIGRPTCKIQPWMFGDDASKQTCFWTKNLPPLEPTTIVCPQQWHRVRFAADMDECPDCGEPYCPDCETHYAECACIGPMEDEATIRMINGVEFGTRTDPPVRPVWGNQSPGGQNKLGPSPDRWKDRSRTYPGIAKAMAEQWG